MYYLSFNKKEKMGFKTWFKNYYLEKTMFSLLLLIFLLPFSLFCDTIKIPTPEKSYPVLLQKDTLYLINTGIGAISAKSRTDEVNKRLGNLAKTWIDEKDSLYYLKDETGLIIIYSDEKALLEITKQDAILSDKNPEELAQGVILRLTEYHKKHSIRLENKETLYENSLYSLLYLLLLVLYFLIARRVFPFLYKKAEIFSALKVFDIQIKKKHIVKPENVNSVLQLLLRGIYFALSVFLVYVLINATLHEWPLSRSWDLKPVIASVSLLVFYSVLFYVAVKGVFKLYISLNKKLESYKGNKIKTLKIKSAELLSEDRAVSSLQFINKIIRITLIIAISYIYVTIVFSLFEFSNTWAQSLFRLILTPVNMVWTGLVDFLPNLFFIIVLSVVFHYVIKTIRFVFIELDTGHLEFPGFYRDWAMPTYKIVRFMVYALAAVVIFPYLPGSNSPFFRGISVFLGVLFSLGSSSAIANMVAGTVLTYMRPFKIGDRVKISDTIGDVIEKTLLVTRVRTTKNVDITIPNAMVLGSHIVNFSSSAKDMGLILHTTVTIGYDVPWVLVHELLIKAAIKTEHILSEPKPFVLQTSLDDFYVSYELNAFTQEANKMALIYSSLHANIQDSFNEANVEIMSPHYGAHRDGNQTTIPSDYLSKDYQPPSFRLFGVNLFNQKKD
jgi:small-conductance mechanosensitive channel